MLAQAVELTRQALWLAVLLSLPAIAAAALASFVFGLFASATQIQDPTFTFVPRLAAVVLAFVAFGAWGAHTMLQFTGDLWRAAPTLVR